MLTMECKMVAVISNRTPIMVAPIPIKETLVIISCDSVVESTLQKINQQLGS